MFSVGEQGTVKTIFSLVCIPSACHEWSNGLKFGLVELYGLLDPKINFTKFLIPDFDWCQLILKDNLA